MHTSDGMRPVYYYTEETYRPTMLRALEEFLNKDLFEQEDNL